MCFFKQWKTISTKELEDNGYPVYGANGVIGYSSKYNHEEPTVMICCRGATCGTINISKGRCYINKNAMAIENISKDFDVNFIVYFLKNYDFTTIITGAAQPQITQKGLDKIKIPLISLEKQKRIVNVLKIIDVFLLKKKNTILSLDHLVKSLFVEMFGDPDLSSQKKEWSLVTSFSRIVTGTTPSTSDPDNWNGNILWVTPAEIKKDEFFMYDTERKITEKGKTSKSLSLMPIGTVILSTRAPIGKVAIVGKEMTCNQGFKNFICNKNVDPVYLYFLLKFNSEYLNSIGSGTTFKEISKSKIESLKMPIPPIKLQNEFATFVKLIDKSKFVVQKEIKDLQELLDSKMDEYFGGDEE